jgi:hypothetical protein
MCSCTKIRKSFQPKQKARGDAHGCLQQDLLVCNEWSSLPSTGNPLHQIPIRSCQDGLFTLKTLINAHKNHHLPSFVVFVDLVKAYDTVNHDLLLRILEKYGAPPKFVASIHTMYTDLVVVLKIEKEIQEILQNVGVRQGNNMAPVLFLFLMSAAAKTLEVKWCKTGIAVLKVLHSSDNELESGCIRGHISCMYNSTRLTAFEIFLLLYINNGAFPFPD